MAFVFICQYAGNAAAKRSVRGLRWALRGTHPSRRHSSVRLVSGDSLGTGAAYAASVAAHAHRMPCRHSGCPSKHPTTRPSLRLIRVGARGALRPLRALRFARGYPPLRFGAFPAPADSCGAPRPHAARSAVARLGRNTSLRRIGGISLASVRVSRRHRLRLVPPPLQPLRSFMALRREVCRICACRSVTAPYEDH